MNLLSVSWYFYAIGALTLALVLVGYLYRKEVVYSAGLEVANSSYQAALVTALDDLENKSKECTLTDTTIAELEQGKSIIQSKTDEVNSKLDKLKTTVFKVANTNSENLNHETIPNVLPDDGVLSDAIVRLLKQSYCSVESEDDYCNHP